MFSLDTYFKTKQALIETALKEVLPPVDTRPHILHEAMHYTVFNGGKRIRPILCLAAAKAIAEEEDLAIAPAVAVELFHCSTLIHDDLPCMDDDDLRRGLPTCHIKYGEANAVLTGDALMILAFEVLADSKNARLIKELSSASGSRGVIAGQVEDLAAENEMPSPEKIQFIHKNKTAVLINAALRMGALASGANDVELEAISTFGIKLGIAFQIVDDILDEVATDECIGKPVGSDQEQGKMTYPSVFGLDESKLKVKQLTTEALDAIKVLKHNTKPLQVIAQYLVDRSY